MDQYPSYRTSTGGLVLGPCGGHAQAVLGLETGSTCPLTLGHVLQAAGGAAGDHEAKCDGEWHLSVSAVWGAAGLPGQLLGVLQRLPEGKTCSALPFWRLGPDQLCYSVALYPVSEGVCVFVHVRACTCDVQNQGVKESLASRASSREQTFGLEAGWGPLLHLGIGSQKTCVPPQPRLPHL